MAHYKFHYFKGQSKPEKTIEAKDDADAYRQIKEFLKQEDGKLVPKSIFRTYTESWSVDDPDWIYEVA